MFCLTSFVSGILLLTIRQTSSLLRASFSLSQLAEAWTFAPIVPPALDATSRCSLAMIRICSVQHQGLEILKQYKVENLPHTLVECYK